MTEHRATAFFAITSLLPAVLLIVGAARGGIWPLIALFSVTVLVSLMDRIGPGTKANPALRNRLPRAIGVMHFASLAATLWALGSPAHLDSGQSVVLVIAMGLYVGQVSNACAHELIHRADRLSRALGTAVYCSVLNGQHVSAHLLIHHVHAGTARDPNSAPLGRGFYRYALSATVAEFADGLRAETRRRRGSSALSHPYVAYLGGGALSLLAAAGLAGGTGVLALIVIALHAQMQLLLSDYVQHYGLQRRETARGKPEPMGPQHSWNAPQAYSAAMMLNAPRHSDHHMHPARTFADLRLDPAQMPVLPYSVPLMGVIALLPPLWRRLMDPRVRAWHPQPQSHPVTDPVSSPHPAK